MEQNLFWCLKDFDLEKRQYPTGVLPSQDIRKFVACGFIKSQGEPIEENQIQPASLDLRLGKKAYEIEGSFLPSPFKKVEGYIRKFSKKTLNLKNKALLERGKVYLAEVQEVFYLPKEIWAKANPKSSIGRLDIFVRLVFDFASQFDILPPGYKGKVWVEITPHSFPVIVKEGLKLNQIRFKRGNPPFADSTLLELYEKDMLLELKEISEALPQIQQGLKISARLKAKDPKEVIGYRAKETLEPIDLTKVAYYEPDKFWDKIYSSPKGLFLEPGKFYILSSREKIKVPPNFAAEMIAYCPEVGEFRAHYAGFFDPGFGFGKGEVKGARVVLEVRPHSVPFWLQDGQIIGKIKYERLLVLPDKVYNPNIGSFYQAQDLSLSKYFKKG